MIWTPQRTFKCFSLFCLGLSLCVTASDLNAQNSRATVSPNFNTRTPNRAKRPPFKLSPIQNAGFEKEINGVKIQGQPVANDFGNRGVAADPMTMSPAPIGRTYTPEQVHGKMQLPFHGPKDEYLIDGSDRNHRVYVDENWEVHGLDTEDTIGHFDTLDGRRVASPSNRVAIYAPRFATIRRVADISGSSRTARLATTDEHTGTAITKFDDITSSAKQNLQALRHRTTRQPLAFLDKTRGVTNETVLHVAGLTAGFTAYENIELIKFGRMKQTEGSRLNISLQSAQAWTDNLRVLVDNSFTKLILVNDVAAAQDVTISETKGANPTLRVAKVASRITAQPGDTVDFTIRFDNVGNQTIGNVTIIDSLTGRLEFVEGSAECSIEGKLVKEDNDAGSLTLRWEIEKPLPIGKGGIIRFKCRVR